MLLVAAKRPGATTLTDAEADLAGSVLLVAVMVAVRLWEPEAAVKLPLESTVPAAAAAPPRATPVTAHVTPAESPEAANCRDAPVAMAADAGVTEMTMFCGGGAEEFEHPPAIEMRTRTEIQRTNSRREMGLCKKGPRTLLTLRSRKVPDFLHFPPRNLLSVWASKATKSNERKL